MRSELTGLARPEVREQLDCSPSAPEYPDSAIMARIEIDRWLDSISLESEHPDFFVGAPPGLYE